MLTNFECLQAFQNPFGVKLVRPLVVSMLFFVFCISLPHSVWATDFVFDGSLDGTIQYKVSNNRWKVLRNDVTLKGLGEVSRSGKGLSVKLENASNASLRLENTLASVSGTLKDLQ